MEIIYDKVLGPCQHLIQKSTLSNTIQWIIMVEILNFHQEKWKPKATLVLINVNKILGRLALRSLKIPILQEFQTAWKPLAPTPAAAANFSQFQAKKIKECLLIFLHYFRCCATPGWLWDTVLPLALKLPTSMGQPCRRPDQDSASTLWLYSTAPL